MLVLRRVHARNANYVARPLNRLATVEIWKRERRYPVTSVLRAQNREQCLVTFDREHLTVALGPVPRRERSRKQFNCRQIFLHRAFLLELGMLEGKPNTHCGASGMARDRP